MRRNFGVGYVINDLTRACYVYYRNLRLGEQTPEYSNDTVSIIQATQFRTAKETSPKPIADAFAISFPYPQSNPPTAVNPGA